MSFPLAPSPVAGGPDSVNEDVETPAAAEEPTPVADDEGPTTVTELATDPAAEPEARSRRSGRPRLRRPGLLTLLVVLALVLAGTTGWLGTNLRRHADWNAQSRAAAAASDTVVNLLWTVSASTSQDVFAALLANSTGSLKSQMSQSAGTFQQVLTSQKVSSAGTVVQTGVNHLHGRTASVLVAVNATITDSKGSTSVRQYRMRATVTKVGARWLVSDLEFVA